MYRLTLLTRRAARAALAVALLCGAARPEAQTASPPRLEFLGRDSVSAVLKAGTVRLTVFVRNPTAGEVHVRPSLLVQRDSQNSEPLPLRSITPDRIKPASVEAVNLEFTVPAHLGERVSGYLVVADAGARLLPATRWVSASPPPSAAPDPKPLFGNVISLPLWLALASMLLAALVLLVSIMVSEKPTWDETKRRFGWMVGAPKWKFTESWASTTTLATAFANTSLIALLADDTAKGLAGVTGVFAVLVLIAPSFYNVSLRPVDEAAAGAEPRYRGWVLLYLLSSVVTLWGALGALYAGYILVTKISWSVLTEDRAIRWFQAMPWVIGAFVMAYGVATIYRTVTEQTDALREIAHPPGPVPAGGTRLEMAGRAEDGTELEVAVTPAAASAAAGPARVRPAFPLL